MTDVRMIPAAQIATLGVHPFAGLLPMMNDGDFDALATDIGQNGVRQPVVLFEGQILDGRNRARACSTAGRDLPTRSLPATIEPRQFVISQNLRRRNLTASQAAMVAARMVTTRHGAAASESDVTQEMAARTANVSPRYVRDAQWLIEHNTEQADAVFAGRITLASAMRNARPRTTRQQQESVVEAPVAAAAPVAQSAPADEMAQLLAVCEWLAAAPRDHAAVLARFGARAAALVPALDDFARRLWDAADEEGIL